MLKLVNQTKIEWSEFHYHLISHLISDECPRDLAKNIELGIFSGDEDDPDTYWIPNEFFEKCVEDLIKSKSEKHLNTLLSARVSQMKLAFPNLRWR